MSYRIKILNFVATIEDLSWKCPESPSIEKSLNTQAELIPCGYYPDPDYAEAQRMAEMFGGELLDQPEEDNSPEGLIY